MSASVDGTIRACSFEGGEVEIRSSLESQKQSPLDLSSDGRQMAIVDASDARKILILDMRSHTTPLEFEASGPVTALAISDDGSTLALSTQDKHQIEVWNIDARALLHSIPLVEHEQKVAFLRFAPDGSSLAAVSGESGECLTLWNPNSGKQFCQNRGDTNARRSILCARYRPNSGEMLVSRRGPATLDVIDIQSRRQKQPQLACPTEALDFEAIDEEQILFGLSSPTLEILNLRDRGRLLRLVFDLPIQSAKVTRVLYCPKQRMVIVADDTGGVHGVSLDVAKQHVDLAAPVRGARIAFSHDGAELAVSDDRGVIEIFDTKTLRVTRELDALSGPLIAMAATADGSKWLAAGIDGVMRVWDNQGKLIQRDWIWGADDPKVRASISADGARWIFWSDADEINAYSLGAPGGWTRPLAKSPEGVWLSPVGDRYAVMDSARGVRIFDWTDGKELVQFSTRVNPPDMAWSPDGKWIAGRESDRNDVTVWNATNGERSPHTIPQRATWSTHYRVSPSGEQVMSFQAGFCDVIAWDAVGPKPSYISADVLSDITDAAWSSNDENIAVVTKDGEVFLWDLKRAMVRRIPTDACHNVTAMAFTQSNVLISVAEPLRHKLRFTFQLPLSPKILSDRLLFSSRWDHVQCWSFGENTPTSVLPDDVTNVPPSLVAVSTQQDIVAYAGNDGRVQVWNHRAKEKLWDASISELANELDKSAKPLLSGGIGYPDFWIDGDPVVAIGFSRDGSRLAAAGHAGSVRVWDAANGEVRLDLPGGELRVPRAIALSADGEWLATAAPKGLLELIHISSGDRKSLERETSITSSVQSLLFLPGDEMLVVGRTNGRIELWDFASGSIVASLAGHGDRVGSLAATSDGRTLASAGPDGTVRLWSVPTRTEVAVFEDLEAGVARALVFSPDDNTLVAGYDSGVVRLWDSLGPSESRLPRKLRTIKSPE